MPLTNLNLPQGLAGPGSLVFPVSVNPLGAMIYVNSATGKDDRRRLNFPGTSSTQPTSQGSTQGPYGDPAKPMASVFGANGALSVVQAGRGDLIVVAQGHVEALPAGVTTVPGGVSILGLGYGNLRPQFQWSANANTEVDSAGAGIMFQGCIFDLTQIAAVVLGFKIAHSGVQFVNCRVIQASTANQAAAAILLNTGADDFLFANSDLDATAAAGSAFGIKNVVLNTINRLTISSSTIEGDYTTAPLSILTVLAKRLLVEFCVFKQMNAAKTVWNLATGNTITGQFTSNDLFAPSAGAHGDFIAGGTGTGLSFFQNFGAAVNASPRSAILIPDVGTVP